MYGDTEVMRRRVRELREQATDVRALADRLVAQTEAVGWAGRAAESLRERMRDRSAHLRAVASRHDTAADSLERHLREVDRLKDSIEALQRRVGDLVADARTRATRLEETRFDEAAAGVRRDLSDADATLLAFDPPPSGHRDWLSVALPGLTTR